MDKKTSESSVNPNDLLVAIKNDIEKFKAAIDTSNAVTAKDRELMANLMASASALESNLNEEPEKDLITDVPFVIGVPEHAGAGDVEPCL